MSAPLPDPPESPLEARRRAREERKLRIVDSANRLFAQRGYAEASMDDIAAQAEVSKPTVYGLFGSKDELFVECLERAGERFRASVARAAGGGDTAQERLWRAILALVEHIESDRDGWAMLLRDQTHAPAAIADEVVRLRVQALGMAGDLFLDGARAAGVDGEVLEAVEPLSRMFVGMVRALAQWWLEHPGVPAETVAAHLMNFAWMGLGDLLEGRLWIPPGPSEPA